MLFVIPPKNFTAFIVLLYKGIYKQGLGCIYLLKEIENINNQLLYASKILRALIG